MQLTPRTLGMALGGCLAGGLVVGVATVISPSIGITQPTPEAGSSLPAYSEAELGDMQVTYPTPSMRVAAPTSTPVVPTAASASPLPTTTPTFASSPPRLKAMAPPTASEVTEAATSRHKPEPTPMHTSTSSISTPLPAAAPKPKVHAAPVQRSNPKPLHHWKPPHLAVGVTDISAPALSSGAGVHVTVMCTPSTGCTATGRSLTVTPDALRVSVTWSARPVSRWRAWSDTSAYTSPAKR